MLHIFSRFTVLFFLSALILGVLVFDYQNQYLFSIGKYDMFFAVLLSILIIAGKVIAEFLLFLSKEKTTKIIGGIGTVLLFITAIYTNTEIRKHNNENQKKEAHALNDKAVLHNDTIERKIGTLNGTIATLNKAIEAKKHIIESSDPKFISLKSRISKQIDHLNKEKLTLTASINRLRDQKKEVPPVTLKSESPAESLFLSILIESLLILFIYTFSKMYHNKRIAPPVTQLAKTPQSPIEQSINTIDRITTQTLKDIRKANNLTQNDLANILDLSQRQISRIEKGDKPLPVNTIAKLKEAELLKTS